jgi:hypothetical protein
MKITYVLEKFRRNPGKHPVVGGLNGYVVLPCYQTNTIGMRCALYIPPTDSYLTRPKMDLMSSRHHGALNHILLSFCLPKHMIES